MSKVSVKEKFNLVMEAKGYEYISWNDPRKKLKGPGYYATKVGILSFGVDYQKIQSNPMIDWNFIMDTAIEFGCKIDNSKQDTVEKAFDKLYIFCYKMFNKSPENQIKMFPKEPKVQEKCACGKNPACECK